MAYRFHIVINNYKEEDYEFFCDIKNNKNDMKERKMKFIFFERHIGEKKKVPHIHVYMEFQVRKSFKDIVKTYGLGRGHVEECYKDRASNIIYITQGAHPENAIFLDE